MKNICILLIMLLLASCKSDEKPDDNLNLRFEVLESEMKYIPTNVGIENTWDYDGSSDYCGYYGKFKPFQNNPCAKNYSYVKLAKIRIINQGEAISLFTTFRHYFPTSGWMRAGREANRTIHCFYEPGYDDCRIFLKKNDSTTIYWGYSSEIQENTDTLGFDLKWKRDSLGRDYMKFYLDNQKKLKFHSIRKGSRNTNSNSHYSFQQYCTILKDIVEDTVIRKSRRY